MNAPPLRLRRRKSWRRRVSEVLTGEARVVETQVGRRVGAHHVGARTDWPGVAGQGTADDGQLLSGGRGGLGGKRRTHPDAIAVAQRRIAQPAVASQLLAAGEERPGLHALQNLHH